MSNRADRELRLLPSGKPRYVRVYFEKTWNDCYTVVFTGHFRKDLTREYPHRCFYVSMNPTPRNPAYGIYQHGEDETMIDYNAWGFAPAIGRKCHLGTRIKFDDLPDDCKTLVLQDYREIWGLDK